MKKKVAETNMIYVDLMLDNGQLIRIECTAAREDDLHESLANAIRAGGWWSPTQFEPCSATYLGTNLDRVAMRRVVGVLL